MIYFQARIGISCHSIKVNKLKINLFYLDILKNFSAEKIYTIILLVLNFLKNYRKLS